MNLDTLLSQLEELVKDLLSERNESQKDIVYLGRKLGKFEAAQELENIVRVARARKD